jgi:hypothetical protein
MKSIKLTAICLCAVLLTGCGGSSDEPQIGDPFVADEYVKINIAAEVDVYPSAATYAADVMTCVGEGTVQMEFYFLKGGGDAIYEDAYYAMTNYDCPIQGTNPCTATPLGNAYDERPLPVNATYNPDTEQIDFHIMSLPFGESVDIEFFCETAHAVPGVQNDPAVLIHLILPLYQEQWGLAATIGEPYESTRTNIELSGGMNYADVTFYVTTEIVAATDQSLLDSEFTYH